MHVYTMYACHQQHVHNYPCTKTSTPLKKSLPPPTGTKKTRMVTLIANLVSCGLWGCLWLWSMWSHEDQDVSGPMAHQLSTVVESASLLVSCTSTWARVRVGVRV